MFAQNLGAFIDALGLENAATAWALAKIEWPSEGERDAFIAELAGGAQ